MPSLSQSRAPTRAPILRDASAPAPGRSNAALADAAGLASPQPASAQVPGAQPAVAEQQTPAEQQAPVEQQAPAEQQASTGDLAGATARLQAGDLGGAANELRQVATTQRRLLAGGGDRAVLQSALAALAVVDALLAAQTAKEAGRLQESSRHAQSAAGTLGRASMLSGALREALLSSAATFGARTGGATLDAAPQGAAAAAREGYDPVLGQALARASASISGGNPRAGGNCYARVADAVDAVIGRFLSGGHAYMAASQLAARKSLFTEVPAANLSSLPAGAIVVWGKGTSDSGHISVALGDGRESSDFVGPQMTRHYGGAGARVFLPKARMAR